jgi:hypothetical protein
MHDTHQQRHTSSATKSINRQKSIFFFLSQSKENEVCPFVQVGKTIQVIVVSEWWESCVVS